MATELTDPVSLSRETAIEEMLQRCFLQPLIEMIHVEEGLDRISAEDVYSKNTLPNQLSSQWDGIAVHGDDFIHGMPDTTVWQEGKEYVFCNTGIGIQGDYDTSIRIEEVTFNEQGGIILEHIPEKGQFTIPVGTRLQEGDLLVPHGTRLTPVLLANLVMGGFNQVKVIKKPVVAFIPTGSELVPPGIRVPLGKNVDSNSIMIHTKLLQWGAEPLIYPIIPDKKETIMLALSDAISKADIVVLNAGSSKGTDDFTIPALAEIGEIICHTMDHGPGYHTSYTVAKNGKPIVGLSGPPGGAEYTADWYVKPLIDHYLGQQDQPPLLQATLTEDVASGKKVKFIVRVCVSRAENGEWLATPISPFRGKGQMLEMNRANGFLTIPPSGEWKAGDRVTIELRYPYQWIS